MLFFGLLVSLALAARILPFLPDWPSRMRLAMSIALVAVGTDHWLTTERYLPMMPPWIGFHRELVLLTGAAEIAGAFALLVPRLRRLAGWCLAVYFVAVFPANVHNMLTGPTLPGLPEADWYYRVRLAFQPLFIWWALFSVGVVRWPFARRHVHAYGSNVRS